MAFADARACTVTPAVDGALVLDEQPSGVSQSLERRPVELGQPIEHVVLRLRQMSDAIELATPRSMAATRG